MDAPREGTPPRGRANVSARAGAPSGLAGLIIGAVARTQILLVSHFRPLVRTIEALADELSTPPRTVELVKEHGRTAVDGLRSLDEPPWHRPNR